MSSDGLFWVGWPHDVRLRAAEIDRSMAIAVEAAQNSNRAIFPLNSKAKKFDGSPVGF
jgi:hypothetical protein